MLRLVPAKKSEHPQFKNEHGVIKRRAHFVSGIRRLKSGGFILLYPLGRIARRSPSFEEKTDFSERRKI